MEKKPFIHERRRKAARPLQAAACSRSVPAPASTFAYYPDGVADLTITDGMAGMLRRAERRAAKAGRHVSLTTASVESLPFEDASFDTVVGSLLLCSVDDQDASRSPRSGACSSPDGRYLFLEHVRSDDPEGRRAARTGGKASGASIAHGLPPEPRHAAADRVGLRGRRARAGRAAVRPEDLFGRTSSAAAQQAVGTRQRHRCKLFAGDGAARGTGRGAGRVSVGRQAALAAAPAAARRRRRGARLRDARRDRRRAAWSRGSRRSAGPRSRSRQRAGLPGRPLRDAALQADVRARGPRRAARARDAGGGRGRGASSSSASCGSPGGWSRSPRVDRLPQVVRLRSGRLPAHLHAAALRGAPDRRRRTGPPAPRATSGSTASAIAELRDPGLFGYISAAAASPAAPPALLIAPSVESLERLPSLQPFYRVYSWLSPLRADRPAHVGRRPHPRRRVARADRAVRDRLRLPAEQPGRRAAERRPARPDRRQPPDPRRRRDERAPARVRDHRRDRPAPRARERAAAPARPRCTALAGVARARGRGRGDDARGRAARHRGRRGDRRRDRGRRRPAGRGDPRPRPAHGLDARRARSAAWSAVTLVLAATTLTRDDEDGRRRIQLSTSPRSARRPRSPSASAAARSTPERSRAGTRCCCSSSPRSSASSSRSCSRGCSGRRCARPSG